MLVIERSLWKPAAKTLPRDEKVLRAFADRLKTLGAPADTGQVSPIVAQRLDPDVMPVFVRDFPLYDLIAKVPANGVSHTFLQQTAFTQGAKPHTISETGVVADDANVYARKTTNIALFAERRGVTLKAQFAGAAAGGPSTDLMERELEGGLLTIARDAQMEMLRFQESDSTSTTDTAANGNYDANGFNGLRYIMQNMAPPENTVMVDVRTAGWTDQRVLRAVRRVVNTIRDKGGHPDLIVTATTGSEAMFEDQMQLARNMMAPGESKWMKITPGQTVQAITTDNGLLPVVIVPGGLGQGGIGDWVDTNGAIWLDINILQTDSLELPYLGAPEPTIIRIPIGTDGQLRELAIPFILLGFAAKAPQFLGRVSLRIG